jgi:hypothetical protein
MAEAAIYYCTRDAVKLLMGYADSSKDTLIDSMLPRVTILFNTAWDRDLRKAERTELYDGTGSAWTFLKQFPLDSTAAFELKIDDDVVDAADYELYKEEGIVKLKQRFSYRTAPIFPIGDRNVSAKYTAGYATGSIPPDIEMAACLMVGHLVESRGVIASALESEKIGNYSYRQGEASTAQEAEKAIPMKIWSMISRYARRDFYAPRRR